jgi:flagellar biosynthesis protein FlhF
MKIKHYKAPDMRTALRQVKDAQGPDAVILSSRRIAGGVEVVAAIDYDGEETATEQLAQGMSPTQGRNVSYGAAPQDSSWVGSLERVQGTSSAPPASRYAAAEDRAPQGARYSDASDRAQQASAYAGANERAQAAHYSAGERVPASQYSERAQASRFAVADDRAEVATPGERGRNVSYGAASQFSGFADTSDLSRFEMADANSDVNEELRSLRRMLENQLATLAWNDLARRSPIQTELLKQLTQLGLAQELATEVVTQLPPRLELAEAHRLALAVLARRIEATGERWMDGGGVVSLVGATGVGKTTLIAKLAARWVLRHGTRDIALVTTDSVRIGAQEQIHTLGRLLGVPAYAIDGAAEVAGALEHLQDKRFVLIDTAGLSPRDPRLEQELAMLAAASKRMETTLVLSAAAQAGAIEEAVQRFAAAQPTTCMLTKLDEATSLGGVISTLIRSRLPVTYVSEGQRVPEDLAPARAHQLIARAVDLSRKSGASADEDLLRRRFGTVAHAIA